VEGILPRDSGAGYYCYRVLVSFDQENDLPIRVVVYDWDDRVVEEYVYTQLRLNAGLTDQDFDPENQDYGFSPWRFSVPR
jgi:negative regulator of sigma E activity